MVSEELARVFFCVGLSHLLSIPLLVMKLPTMPAYVVAGMVLRLAQLETPGPIWEGLTSFSLAFVGLHAGLSSRVRRESVRRVALVSLVNVAISAASVFALLAPATGDCAKSLLMSVLLANTATEGVLGLSRYTRHRADAEAALEISIGDDILVLSLSAVALAMTDSSHACELVIAALAVAGAAFLLDLTLKRGTDRDVLNALAVSTMFVLVSLTFGSVGPLVGGYTVGILLGSAASSGDPLLKMARNVEALVGGLEMVNGLVFLPLVFTYVGLGVNVTVANPSVVGLGLLGAVLGKHLTVALLKRAGLVAPFSVREVAALITVRGSLESAIALAALELDLLTGEEFAALIVTSLLTYPVSTALLSLSRSTALGLRHVSRNRAPNR